MVFANTLLITTDRSVARDLYERLMKLGYRIAGIATSEEEALIKIGTTKPDLILTDIRLEAARGGEIKTGKLIQVAYDLPIIYITESVGQNTIQRTRLTGPFGYVYKPFDDQHLLVTIETALTRHKLERKLRESRQWLNTTLSSIGDGVIATDQQGLVRFINPVAMEYTGWRYPEALGMSLDEVFSFTDESSHEFINAFPGEQEIQHITTKKGVTGLLLPRNGSPIPVEANSTPIRDGKGKVYGMVLVFRDVIEQRRAMQEIQRQAARAEALMQVASRLNSQFELQTVLNTICEITQRTIKAVGVTVVLQNPHKLTFQVMAAISQDPVLQAYRGTQFEIPSEIFQSFLSHQNPVIEIQDIQDYPTLPYLDVFKKADIKNLAIAALFHGKDLIGALIAAFSHNLRDLPHDEIALLKGLADHASTAIENAKLFEQVRAGRERQRKLAKSLVDVQEAERRHIAKELHDHFGQLLTGLQFMLESTKNQATGIQRLELEQIQGSVSDVIMQIREMSLNLRPSMLDDLGLLPTLRWHIDRYTSQTGIKVNFHCDPFAKRFPLEIETAAYRIIQEALTNVARYAQVDEVFVGLVLQEETLWLEILDKGKGFDLVSVVDRPSSGLGGMRERAGLLGGYLVVKSFINQGTQIVAALPLNDQPLERRRHDRIRSIS
jgi:PAS domain S-box-containing protein